MRPRVQPRSELFEQQQESRLSAQTPVWRQLYTEKQVVAEERRLRTDNAPMGRFQVRRPRL